MGAAIAPSIAKTSQFEIASTIAGAVAAATAAPTPQQVHHNIAMHDDYRNDVALYSCVPQGTAELKISLKGWGFGPIVIASLLAFVFVVVVARLLAFVFVVDGR